ncbi:MAG: hypothetical protein RL199_886 [Pseudomonadota bacterium]|jgi:hypothetical protein
MRPAYLTGTNDELFWTACLLLQSFREQEPHAVLGVCDFGLSPGRAAFFDRHGLLWPRPAALGDGLHPWALKASLAEFAPEASSGTMVWVDADMFLVRPVGDGIEAIAEDLRTTGRLAAACPDVANMTLGGFIEHYGAAGQAVGPLKAAREALGVDPSLPYLNSGFVVSGSPAFWPAWKSVTLSMPLHFLFEQNALNLLVGATRAGAHVLDAREWNVHGRHLAELPDDLSASSARLIHATSDGSEHEYVDVVQATRRGTMTCRLKLLRRPTLRRRQLDLLAAFVDAEADALADAGLVQR